jgi:hypothetical protein
VHGFLCDHLFSVLLKMCLCSIILYQELARVVTQRLNEDFEQILWNVVVFWYIRQLQNNMLSGELPAWLASLPSLTELWVLYIIVLHFKIIIWVYLHIFYQITKINLKNTNSWLKLQDKILALSFKCKYYFHVHIHKIQNCTNQIYVTWYNLNSSTFG